MESRIPVPMVSVIQSDIAGPREAGSGCNQDVPPGIMPSLIARLLQTAQEDNPAEVKVPPDAGARRPSVAPGAGTPGWNQLAGDGVLSGGHPGHGVNRCSRVDTSFPFLPRGWSVDIRDGQYRAVWASMAWCVHGTVSAGKRGMVRAGQPRLSQPRGACFPGHQGPTNMGVTGVVWFVGSLTSLWHSRGSPV